MAICRRPNAYNKSYKIRLLSVINLIRLSQSLIIFIGRGAKAIMCNHIVTIRVLRYPLLYQIL